MPLEINGLPLPVALIEALQNGCWRKPAKADAWQALFPGHNASHALLYDLKLIEKENATWRLDSSNRYYLGKRNESRPPGDIDPARSVLIADLEPEKTIALDYRESLVRPSVVYRAARIRRVNPMD